MKNLKSRLTARRKTVFYFAVVLGFIGTATFNPIEIRAQSVAPHSCTSCTPVAERRIYAPTISFDGETGSIVLNCRSEDPIEATPVFYTKSGEAITGTPVTLQANEIRFVTIKSLIPAAHKDRDNWGGMDLQYIGHQMEVWAQITIPGRGQHPSTDVLFSVINNLGSDTLEAVWYQPKPGKRVIALGNSSPSPIQTYIEFSNGEAETVEIPPFGTKYFRKTYHGSQDQGESVKIVTTGPAGSLKASGYVISKDSPKKLASSIRFYDTKAAVQPKLFATNFHAKNEEAHIVLKNTVLDSVNVQAVFRPTKGNGPPVILPPTTIGPSETRELDLSQLYLAAAGRDDMDSVSVEVTNDGEAGTLIGSLNSRNENSDVTYDIPLRDSGKKRISTGAYPWRLDGDFRSVVTITNVGTDSARFGADLFYAGGGRYVFTPTILQVGETVRFNIKKLRDEAIPDQKGNVLPANITSGQFKWSILGLPSETSRLIGRSEVISKSLNVSSSYSCNNNCPHSGPEYQLDGPVSMVEGNSIDNDVLELWRPEYSGPYSYLSIMPGLYTGDTGIAESDMIPNDTAARTEGVFMGDTTWYSGEHTYYYWYDGGSDCYMDDWVQNDYGPVEVDPPCANPTNFRQVGSGSDIGSGSLVFTYQWDSSTGVIDHLVQCTVGEIVGYPGGPGTYNFPTPFPNITVNNPTTSPPLLGNINAGIFYDTHSTPGTFRTPYSANSFNATQYYWYSCPCSSGGFPQQMGGNNTITRSVSTNGGGGSGWKFTVSKSGDSATINPLP